VHEAEQNGYDLIGSFIKRRRLAIPLTQRQLEHLTEIDQTVISRIENGRQYGLRWSRFARLVAVLEGLDDRSTQPRKPWWVVHGIHPPAYMLDSLREEGLLPPEFDPQERQANGDPPI
jgi:transcriptional regulator with XRE-family HTH domain